MKTEYDIGAVVPVPYVINSIDIRKEPVYNSNKLVVSYQLHGPESFPDVRISEERADNFINIIAQAAENACVKVGKDNMPEITGQIIDIFEDFLYSKGITIDNPERDEAAKNTDPLELAIIYGTDYGNIQTALEQILINNNLAEPIQKDPSEISINDLNLTTRTYNCLARDGIRTVGDICKRTKNEMMRVRHLGNRSLEEIELRLMGLGYKFKEEEE